MSSSGRNIGRVKWFNNNELKLNTKDFSYKTKIKEEVFFEAQNFKDSIKNNLYVDISVQEVKRPELNATLIAKSIALQIERRSSYKRAMKKAALSALKSGAKGIKLCCSGRLSGAEIARSEWVREGSVPLHTLRADIDYGVAEALTTYGIIGVKVWLCRGEYPVNKNI